MATTTAPTKPRDATYDIARGIGIMLVIYGHIMEPIYNGNKDLGREFVTSAFQQWQVIYSFHMLLFFFVSGAVNKNFTKKSFVDTLRGSIRLLALAWIVHILGILFFFAIGQRPEFIFTPFYKGYLWSIGVLWFLAALCFVQIMAYLVLKYIPAVAALALFIGLSAIAAYGENTYLTGTWFGENYFMAKTWLPGAAFFTAGYLCSQWQIKWYWYLAIPLFVAVYFLAPLNHGCAFSLSDQCEQAKNFRGIQMVSGKYGNLPLFYLTGLVGSVAVVCLSAGLTRFKGSEIFAYAGRYSLDLFFINGFLVSFYGPLNALPWPHMTVFHYIGLAVGLIALHLGVRALLAPGLKLIDKGALAIASLLTSGKLPAPAAAKA